MPIVFVPGFTQTAASWHAVMKQLASSHRATAIDVPTGLDFVATASAIGTAEGRATYVGYSMGGRLALRLALDHPELVEGLALVSASPGLRTEAERSARRAADEVLARDVETRGVEAFLADWIAQPLFASVPADRAGLRERAEGHTAADLAATLRRLGTGTQEPLWERLGELRMPVALITGRADTKFDAINDEMQSGCTSAMVTRVRIDGGHALPLVAPDAIAHALREWLPARA